MPRMRSDGHHPDRSALLNMLAILAAVSMFGSTLEYLIPKPVPFFRVGLANVPILLVLPFFRTRHTLALVGLKALAQGLINGTLASYVFAFSLAGSFASALVMVALHRALGERISLVALSTAGAVASNVVQVTLSVLLVFGARSWLIAPPFVTIGALAGVAVGLIAQHFAARSRWLARIRGDYARLVGA